MVGVNAAPLLSSHWYRVAALKPQLEAQAQVRRVAYRGEVWQVLSRADGSHGCRLDAAAWAFVGRCDGRLTVQRLWDQLLADWRDDAPTQDELLSLLARLFDAGLLRFDARPDFAAQAGRRWADDAPAERERGPRSSHSLLAFRVPLGRPDAWLARLAPAAAPLFTPAAFAIWAAVLLLGMLGVALNAAALSAQAQAALATPRVLALAWLAYPVVKALHELAHALAVRRFGGSVPEWGVTLLMFTPVPYVDASAATRFESRWQRAIVSGAGIAVELFLAALALGVFFSIEAGWLRDLALAVFLIGSVSTLLVNGNPLLRFDGYHLFTDLLELPNLATRSGRHWRDTWRALLLRLPAAAPLRPAAGEAAWLWAYAPAAWLWQLALCAAIVGWLGGVSLLLGASMAGYFAWTILLRPLWQGARLVMGAAGPAGATARRRAGLAGAGLLLAVAAVPLPFSSVVQGVVWLPEQALLRAGTSGFISQVDAADGARVAAGDRLFTLEAPALQLERARLQARLDELDTERFQALRSDRPRAASVAQDLAQAEAELARLDERQAQLGVSAQRSGTVVLAHAADLPGRWVPQGTVLGQVLAPGATTVRVAIAQEQAALVQAHTRAVSVRLADAPGSAWPAELLRSDGGTARQLPSAALSDTRGGAIATDPTDPLLPLRPVVLADVRLAADLGPRAGGRAWVRFDHGLAPLAWQWARRAQQLLLRHFNPAQ